MAFRQPGNCMERAKRLFVDPLLQRRSMGEGLGNLGPCTFSEPASFFDDFLIDAEPPLWDYSGQHSVVAGGDVHGDFVVLLSLLLYTQCIDDHANWAGGGRVLVLVGDLLDSSGRCREPPSGNVREEVDILQYLHFLRTQARMNQGDVVTLLGNHEVARVDRWPFLAQYVAKEQIIGWGGQDVMDQLFDGPVRHYIAQHFPLFARVGTCVFVHASVPLDIERHVDTITSINRDAYAYLLRQQDDPRLQKFFQHVMSPMLQNRAPMNPPTKEESDGDEKTCEANIDKLLAFFGIPHGSFVFGHSVQKSLSPGAMAKSGELTSACRALSASQRAREKLPRCLFGSARRPLQLI